MTDPSWMAYPTADELERRKIAPSFKEEGEAVVVPEWQNWATDKFVAVESAIQKVADETKTRPADILASLWRGYKGSAAGFYQAGANLTGASAAVIAKVDEALEGRKTQGLHTGIKAVSDWFQGWADHLREQPDGKPSGVGGLVENTAEMIGAMPLEIAKIVVPTKVLGPLAAGAYAVVENLDQGPVKAATQGVLASGAGYMLGAGQQAPLVKRMIGEAAIGGGYGAGGGPAQAIVGAAAGAAGGAIPATKKKPVVRPGKGKKPTPPEPGVAEMGPRDRAGNINLKYTDTTDDIKKALRATAEEYEGFMDARRGVQSHEATKQLAQSMGMSVESLLKRQKGAAFNAEMALSARDWVLASGAELESAARKAVETGADADLLFFQRAFDKHVAIQEQVSGMTAEAGRALNSFKIPSNAGRVDPHVVQEMVAQRGGNEKLRGSAQAFLDLMEKVGTDPGKRAAAARKAYKAGPLAMVQEVWYAGLLSGPQTHLTNIASNTLTMLYTGLDDLAAAVPGVFRSSNDKAYFGEAMARIGGQKRALKAASGKAMDSFLERTPAGTGTTIEAPKRAIPGPVGQAIRTPLNALSAEDSFFRYLNYAGEMEALAYRSGRSKGFKGEKLAEHMREVLGDPPKEMERMAWDRAAKNTFTKELGGDWVTQIGKRVQQTMTDVPVLKFVVPFVRTPTNLAKWSIERSPLAPSLKTWRDEIAKGGAARDRALSQVMLGTTIGATAAVYAADGKVVGSLPRERHKRVLWEMAGVIPYSFHVGDQYISFERFSPFAEIFGVSADMQQAGDLLTEGELGDAAGLVVASIASNYTNKTYMKGLSDAFEALDSQDVDGMVRMLEELGASAAAPGATAQYTRAHDPYIRDAQGLLDKVKARTPGLSTDISPSRDLFGKERTWAQVENDTAATVVPIRVKTATRDKVVQEMLKLEVYPELPERVVGKVRLNDKQHDDYSRISGQTAEKTLRLIVQSKGWDEYKPYVKEKIIRDVFTQAREYGRAELARLYPGLFKEQVEAKVNPILEGMEAP